MVNKKLYKGLSKLVIAVMIVLSSVSGIAHAATGDIINTTNQKMYSITSSNDIKALIADLKDGGGDVFLKEDSSGKYYNPNNILTAQTAVIVKLLKAANVSLTDPTAIKTYIKNNAASIMADVKLETEKVATQTVDTSNYTTPTVANLTVSSVNAINDTAMVGDTYTLSTTVAATLSDGTTKDLAVTWDKVASTTVAGTYTFIGTLVTVEGVVNTNNVTVSATLTVAAPVVIPTVATVSAINGSITVVFNNALTVAPVVADFAVTQTSGTEVIVPTKVIMDSTMKIATLTVPIVAVTEAEQSIVYGVSYKSAAIVNAAPFIVTVPVANSTITGTVKNSDGTPATVGSVEITPQNGDDGFEVSINNGSFTKGGLADGAYEVIAVEPKGSQFANSLYKSIIITKGVISSESGNNIELSFTNPLITVAVKNPDGTSGTSGIVIIYSVIGQGSSYGVINNGEVIIGGLADGVYNMAADTYGDSQYANSVMNKITIINGKVSPATDANVEVNFTNPMITGIVKNPDGTLATSGHISVYSKTGGMISASIYNGKFLIGGLADGIYYITAYPRANSQFTNSITKMITITDGKVSPATDANVEVDFTNPMITGIVKNLDGSLVTAGNVSISSQDRSLLISLSINKGKFLIGGLVDGVYNIVAFSDEKGQYVGSIIKTITITDGKVSPASDANIELDLIAQ
ncbi:MULTISPECIES: Ig-like domain-containing protein [Clostridium]|uniref:Ig-like domain-containing protein n=1 Tax=Clostridium frigoriphilum TaxID=443253 RepID=A0ABU7UVA9_9CLOT|nr:Ig-like domain-containing protein [Clostridium sp. DSM 17811]MBU3101782.1 Ig-like domain-containing protein [Clostridium sp. DSM 17811]